MVRRVQRMIALIGIPVALSVTPLLMPRAGGAEVQPACAPRTDTVPWDRSDLDIPDVHGFSLEAAYETLTSEKLYCMVMNDQPSEVDENAVVVAHQEIRGVEYHGGLTPVVGLWLGVVLPDLRGQTLNAANEVLSQLGLVAGPSPAKGPVEWTVVTQTPAAGEYVVFGDEVGLVLQEPIQPVPVPDLVGHTEDEAKKLVEAAKLVYVGRVIKDGKRPGRVVSQVPRPQELVDVGSRVAVNISRTPPAKPVVVPDVVGLDETEARTAIEAVKLVFDPRIVKEGPGLGRVVWQFPTSGRRVPLRTAVTVNIERGPGPQPPRTIVPDVIGQQEPNAKKAIGTARLKFQSQVIRPGSGVGIVLSQRPLAGTEVDVDSIVTVDLTREPSPQLVPVPDLVDRSEDEARGVVERAQLIFDLLGGEDFSGRPRHVVRQVPPAGNLVPAGTTVTVELAADQTNGTPWLLLPLLIGVGLLAGGTATGLQRRRSHRRHSGPPHVRAVGRPLTLTSTRIQESGPAHRIRVKSRLDRGRQYLQEEEADERH